MCLRTHLALQRGLRTRLALQFGHSTGLTLQLGHSTGLALQLGLSTVLALQLSHSTGLALQLGHSTGLGLQLGHSTGLALQLGHSKVMARTMALFLAWTVVKDRPIARTIICLQVLPYDITLGVFAFFASKSSSDYNIYIYNSLSCITTCISV